VISAFFPQRFQHCAPAGTKLSAPELCKTRSNGTHQPSLLVLWWWWVRVRVTVAAAAAVRCLVAALLLRSCCNAVSRDNLGYSEWVPVLGVGLVVLVSSRPLWQRWWLWQHGARNTQRAVAEPRPHCQLCARNSSPS